MTVNTQIVDGRTLEHPVYVLDAAIRDGIVRITGR
jgi:hypothetical protein